MRRRLSVLLLASLGVLGAMAPSASGAANPVEATCLAIGRSNAEPGTNGPAVSATARVDGQALGELTKAFAHTHGFCVG
jgi:hypothetical protein